MGPSPAPTSRARRVYGQSQAQRRLQHNLDISAYSLPSAQFVSGSPEVTYSQAHFQDLDAVSTSFNPFAQPVDVSYAANFMPDLVAFGKDDGVMKFPVLDAPEFPPFRYNAASVASPSVVSSHSSTTSRRSSSRSTLSSIQTDFVQQQQQLHMTDALAGPLMRPRGPTPLRNNVSTLPSPSEASSVGTIRAADDVPIGPVALNADLYLGRVPVFAQMWIFPMFVSGATMVLATVSIYWFVLSLAVPKENPLQAKTYSTATCAVMQPTPSVEKSLQAQATPAHQDSVKERRLKMEMTIATSKKKCREQLRNVVERKFKRSNSVVTPRSIESPGALRSRTPRMFDSVGFPIIWEHGVLPFLIEMMPKWCGPGHVISVTRGKKRDSRRVCFMTSKPISTARKIMIAGHVRDLLPESHKGNVSFVFSVGEVERLTWARGLSKDMPDEVCSPRNPFCYISPQMGDSIGMVLPDGDDITATLGPCVNIGDAGFWIANLHPFIDAKLSGEPPVVEHPSPADRDRCLKECHDALETVGLDFRLGRLTATSGYDLKTTRVTHDPYWEDCDKEPPLVVTDWALISSSSRQANMLRKFPNTATPSREVPITKMSSVVPGVEVHASGRTSGYQCGQVCEIPAYIDGKKNGTGKATREWFIEEPYPCDDEEAWIRGGIGVSGDSGAAIVDSETNALIGQLWGRNRYFGPGPRFTYFTPVFDVFDDIQERCGQQTRPRLPQYRDEADRWPQYPICRPCFDLQEYMASRRSSRESLMSMIPGAGVAGDNEHDLFSVSELATPKEGGDQSFWVRHTGLEDAGSSFNSVVSPRPMPTMSTFFHNPHVASPRAGILEMRSPYAMELNDEDLHDHVSDSPYGGLGKRAATSVALVRSGSQQSAKRRRIM
ncbi:uncharacterized protein JN550_000581 [Neoarthrinium moseri]|uniref:uncharacterized protein n=1 Tax=Neoarthrinium moseri TaxID=1658444 RepID=UPI001FDC467E|nr:uncharacterized protein JN550_000581 [Neoarthrinium moseri]KAI1878399.1 hypothetical protein JN550_000581 [Neoarthrinium moseri]